jgi:hypothetical protein
MASVKFHAASLLVAVLFAGTTAGDAAGAALADAAPLTGALVVASLVEILLSAGPRLSLDEGVFS